MAQTLTSIEFSDFLVERQALTDAQLLDVQAEQWQGRTDLADAIVARGYLQREEVERLLREYEGLHVVYV